MLIRCNSHVVLGEVICPDLGVTSNRTVKLFRFESVLFSQFGATAQHYILPYCGFQLRSTEILSPFLHFYQQVKVFPYSPTSMLTLLVQSKMFWQLWDWLPLNFGAVINVSDRMNPDDFGAISEIPSQIRLYCHGKCISRPKESNFAQYLDACNRNYFIFMTWLEFPPTPTLFA